MKKPGISAIFQVFPLAWAVVALRRRRWRTHPTRGVATKARIRRGSWFPVDPIAARTTGAKAPKATDLVIIVGTQKLAQRPKFRANPKADRLMMVAISGDDAQS